MQETKYQKKERERREYEQTQATLVQCNMVAAREAERERLARNHATENVMLAVRTAMSKQVVVPEAQKGK